MSEKEQSLQQNTHNEIIIIRKSKDNDQEEHSGEVWKIAYADFMTTLMTFFLVMWLINSITDEQRKAVVGYFNPITLVELENKTLGLNDNVLTESKDDQIEIEKDDLGENSVISNEDDKKLLEVNMPNVPYQTNHMLDIPNNEQADNSLIMNTQERLFRDPFSPDYWEHNIPFDIDRLHEVESIKNSIKDTENMLSTKDTENMLSTTPESMDFVEDFEKKETKQVVSYKQKHEKILNEIMTDIANLVEKDSDKEKPNLYILQETDGVKIELTDKQDYGMFSVGSAHPNPRFVSLLEKIAQILKKHPGMVIISGHTDGRPYKNKTLYNNWQLSVARAQMAYHMLVRGGLSEDRFFRIEGYADRDLKNNQNAYADENRRISIFLQLKEGT